MGTQSTVTRELLQALFPLPSPAVKLSSITSLPSVIPNLSASKAQTLPPGLVQESICQMPSLEYMWPEPGIYTFTSVDFSETTFVQVCSFKDYSFHRYP